MVVMSEWWGGCGWEWVEMGDYIESEILNGMCGGAC